MTLFAAPRLRKFLCAVTQGSQSLALGLALVAASQLTSSMWPQELLQQSRARLKPSYFAMTPTLAIVAPLVIEGTAQTYKTIPATGARASSRSTPMIPIISLLVVACA